jgi:hypothetical protein
VRIAQLEAAAEAPAAQLRYYGACPARELKEWLMTDTVLDGSGEQIPGRRPLQGTDLEIAYALLGDDLVLRVNKSGVQVFGVVLENAAKAMTGQELMELKAENSDLVVAIGTRGQAARDVGYRLGRVAAKLLKATRGKR